MDIEMGVPDSVDDEFLDSYPDQVVHSPLATLQRHKRKIIGLAAVFVFLLVGIAVASAIVFPVVFLTGGEENSDVDLGGAFVRTTIEYQIGLEYKSQWAKRDEELSRWIDAINKNSEYLELNAKDANGSARLQYDVTVSGSTHCYNSRSIRVRNYISGHWVNNSYVDIKGNSKKESEACDLPFTPADKYLDSASQKCEHDRHACEEGDKYSKEARIFFMGQHLFFTNCSEMVDLYPYAFDSLPSNKHGNPVTTGKAQPWWIYSFEGFLEEDTTYEISFTLLYKTEDEAKNGGVAPSSGEYSIRITTKDYGKSTKWNEAVVADMEHLYVKLQEEFYPACEKVVSLE